MSPSHSVSECKGGGTIAISFPDIWLYILVPVIRDSDWSQSVMYEAAITASTLCPHQLHTVHHTTFYSVLCTAGQVYTTRFRIIGKGHLDGQNKLQRLVVIDHPPANFTTWALFHSTTDTHHYIHCPHETEELSKPCI